MSPFGVAPNDVARWVRKLRTDGCRQLEELSGAAILDAWNHAIADLVDDPCRSGTLALLARSTNLDEETLRASLQALTQGLRDQHAADFASVPHPPRPRQVGLVVLAATTPGVGLQILLPALRARVPLVFKNSSSDPLLMTAFLERLAASEPTLGRCYRADAWSGSAADHQRFTSELLENVDRCFAYGRRPTLERLANEFAGPFFAFGPGFALGYVADAAQLDPGALARDVALFDQRGCLSLRVVFAQPSDARRVAQSLAQALRTIARELPTTARSAAELAQLQSFRLRQEMHGNTVWGDPATGLVALADRGQALELPPGARSVMVQPVSEVTELGAVLEPVAREIQGVATVGAPDADVTRLFEQLRIHRVVPAGRLQETDAFWHNGGHDPLALFVDADPRSAGAPER